MKRIGNISVIVFFIQCIFLSTLLFSQANKEALQKGAKDLQKKALESAANIFAEKEYKLGIEALADAGDYSKDPADAEKMTASLNTATENFKIAIDKAKELSPNFTQLLKIRELVLYPGVDVSNMSPWKDGEDSFRSAVENFKDKDNEGVKKYSEKAEKYYKDAEFLAIKDKYHTRLVTAIEKADDDDVDAYAPVTFNKIKQMAKDIESILTANRYDTLKARELLNSAFYEINHGQYMKRVFTSMKKEDKTFEDLQLQWEEPLAKIGAIYTLPRSFDKGFEDYTASIIGNINSDKAKLAASIKENETLTANLNSTQRALEEAKSSAALEKKENQKLSTDVDSLKKVNDLLSKSRDELSNKIASIEVEKKEYKTKVEDQQKYKDLIAEITSLFLPSEAEVIRTGDLVTIRLVNFVFPASKATIDPQYYNLLGKVQKAIKTFPNASVVVEGHTDGQGDYKKNIETSQARANAVYQYLLSNMGAEAKNITATGLGGSKPIANNNTEEGRAKNRRIEIVFNPNMEKSK